MCKRVFVYIFFLYVLTAGLLDAAPVSLINEIARLERNTSLQNSQERFNALMNLARLYMLSGDAEAALSAYERALLISPNDGQALLEQGKLLISQGEFERAALSFTALLSGNRDSELFIQGRYYAAQLEAFRTGNSRALAALAEDPDFRNYRSSIYYTLWMINRDREWQTRIIREFPQSPEARIVSNSIQLNTTPFWVLFPGRENSAFGTISQTAAPPAGGSLSMGEAVTNRVFLQTGLYSREDNAGIMAANLRRAGFEPVTLQRQQNGDNRWAVGVYVMGNENALIRQLRDAGFESFPVR